MRKEEWIVLVYSRREDTFREGESFSRRLRIFEAIAAAALYATIAVSFLPPIQTPGLDSIVRARQSFNSAVAALERINDPNPRRFP